MNNFTISGWKIFMLAAASKQFLSAELAISLHPPLLSPNESKKKESIFTTYKWIQQGTLHLTTVKVILTDLKYMWINRYVKH